MSAPAPIAAHEIDLPWMAQDQLFCSACGVHAVQVLPESAGVGWGALCAICEANRAYATDDERSRRKLAIARREKAVWKDQT